VSEIEESAFDRFFRRCEDGDKEAEPAESQPSSEQEPIPWEPGGEKVAEERFACRKAFGERLGLGVACHLGNIVKMSGLMEHSNGSGWDRATVWHIVIDEHLQRGRLVRKPGDLLCRKRSSLGRRSMGVTGTREWDNGRPNTNDDPDPSETPITCKACLERLRRIQGKNHKENDRKDP